MIPDKIAEYADYNSPPFLLQQYVDSDVEKLVAVFDPQYNELEDMFFDFFTKIWLDWATGVLLDVLGVHLGLLREGRTDTEYREVLKIKGFLNRTAGTPETTIAIMRSLFGGTDIIYRQPPMVNENYDAGDFTIDYDAKTITINGKVLDWSPATVEIKTDADISYFQFNRILPSGVRGLLLGDLICSRTDQVDPVIDVYDETILLVRGD